MVFWDNLILELLDMELSAFLVSCCFKNCEDNFIWMFTGVYDPVLAEERDVFSNELGAIRGLWHDPWCVGGDFNVVRFLEERRNCQRLLTSMRRFSQFIEEMCLKDLPLSGGLFTWCGGSNNESASRLDRFLVSDDWENHFSGLFRNTLPKPVLDHAPILLDGGGKRKGKMPFRFENMLLKVEGFKDLIRNWWEGYSVQGSFSHILAVKLKALKQDLKIWNKEVLENVTTKKLEALAQLGLWDVKERERALTVEETEVRRGVVEEFKKWAEMEEISWGQKSRELWLKEGDKNTSFFHKMAKLRVDGVLLDGEDNFKEAVTNAFQRILAETGEWRLSLDGLDFDCLQCVDSEVLETPFSEEEVLEALSNLCGDKALGPDGFTLAFWQHCWDFVKPEVMGLFC